MLAKAKITALFFLSLSMATGSYGGAVRAAGPGAVAAPTFDWPDTVTVPVLSNASKKGQSMQSAFKLVAIRDADGTYLITHKDYEILAYNGEAVDTDAERAQVAPLMALAAFVPTYRITPAGDLLALEDFDVDRVLKALRAFIVSRVPQDEQSLAKLDQALARLKSPEMQEQIIAKTGETWRYWVELWRHAALAEGESVSLTSVVPIFGAEIEQETRVRHLGPNAQCDACVHYLAESVLEGTAFKDALVGMLRRQAQGLPADRAAGFEAFVAAFEGIRREIVIDTVIVPKTLQPHRVSVTSRTVMRVEGRPPREQVDSKAWVFDWRNATR